LPGAGCLITGTKPVPLQAGQISSTTSDLMGFIERATPATNHEPFNYIFWEMSNQLYGVTLNGKVKLAPHLIWSWGFEYLRHGLRR
jgi:hypothetical protein